MLYNFFHDPSTGSEWYLIQRMNNGTYKAICTHETKVYKIGSIRNFLFEDKQIWHKGKFKPNSHSLTNLEIKSKQRF